jgi:hypothetical protein
MPGKTPDMLEVEAEIWDEFGSSNWISNNPASQAVLMAAKQEHRLKKNKAFNGFILEQKSLDNSEFTQFINQLRTSASDIPPGTRIQLAVLTRFVDPDYEWSIDYEEGKRTCAHWTAVDLLVDEHGKVSSFVLDAANAQGFQRIHARLKEIFPQGEHYVYKADIGATGRASPIQTQEIGCSVFAIEHLKQLSQINTATLYNKELPKISDADGAVKASNFTGGLKLTRIFRGMQTWTGIRSLPEAMKTTPLKDTSSETVLQYAENQSVMQGGFKPIKTNETISRRNLKYIDKKRDYYNALSPEMQERILEDKGGFTFLQHPQLFKLSDMLANIDTSENNDALMTFVQEFSHGFASSDAVEETQRCIQELTALSEQQSPGAIKHVCLLSVAALYRDLEKNPRAEPQEDISRNIEQLYQRNTQNPAQIYRAKLQESDFDSSDSDDNSNDDSPRSTF